MYRIALANLRYPSTPAESVTLAVQDRYLGIATGRYPDQYGWLTAVPATAGAAR